jgi:hypothetical protein
MLLPILFQTSYEIFPVALQAGVFTVTEQLSDLLLPSAEVAVIIAIPAAIPVTSPLLLTVAIEGLLEDQIRVLLVALVGKTVPVIKNVEPILTEAVDGKVIEETNTVWAAVNGDRTEPGITSEGIIPD